MPVILFAKELVETAKSKAEKVAAAYHYYVAVKGMYVHLRGHSHRALTIIDLVNDSETPLDRKLIGQELQQILFPEPLDRRRSLLVKRAIEHASAVFMKHCFRAYASLSAAEANQEVAKRFKLTVNEVNVVEALKKRRKRLLSELKKELRAHPDDDLKFMPFQGVGEGGDKYLTSVP
jgi:hypothetical protein